MHSQQDPVINNWYTNLTGKLFKVRMVSYIDAGVVNLVIEHIDGSKQIISRLEWDCLRLMRHNTGKSNQTLETQEKLTH
ncbi:MAG: hypothetical protein OEM38_05985 [Gammaproteobacteria bacterium]|nr:hypothetical protein [Gammaproteobacteria bacterium]